MCPKGTLQAVVKAQESWTGVRGPHLEAYGPLVGPFLAPVRAACRRDLPRNFNKKHSRLQQPGVGAMGGFRLPSNWADVYFGGRRVRRGRQIASADV